MASFLTGPAAHLVGKGMQAMGVGIPMNDCSSKIIENMRGCGIPVPPQSWFKRRPSASNEHQRDEEPTLGLSGCSGRSRSKSTSDLRCGRRQQQEQRTIYDELEGHVHGIMQVVKPVIELKSMVREGCCRSADPPRRAQRESPREEPRYFTPQRCSNSECSITPQENEPVKTANKKQEKVARQRAKVAKKAGRQRQRADLSDEEEEEEEEEEESCMYCPRKNKLLELPCGGFICAKCDQIEEHDLDCKKCKDNPRLHNRNFIKN